MGIEIFSMSIETLISLSVNILLTKTSSTGLSNDDVFNIKNDTKSKKKRKREQLNNDSSYIVKKTKKRKTTDISSKYDQIDRNNKIKQLLKNETYNEIMDMKASNLKTSTKSINNTKEQKHYSNNCYLSSIVLNIGGVKYETTLITLLKYKDCIFNNMKIDPNRDGSYFID
eukprot:8784_1